MIVHVYRYQTYTRSVIVAQSIAEFWVPEIPDDESEFAEQHGGDFIEIVEDDQE